MLDRQVRVVCRRPHHNHPMGPIEGPSCGACGAGAFGPPGHYLATLADPDAEALMADGERYRALPPEIRLEYELCAEFEPEDIPPPAGAHDA